MDERPDPVPAPVDEPPGEPGAAANEGASTAPSPEQLRSALYGRWQEPPISQVTTRRVEMRRLADSMRIIIERLVASAAPTESIIEAANELARVALTFDRALYGTRYEGHAEAATAGGDAHASFEHSPFIGRANPLAPPIYLQELDGRVHGRVVFGSAYEGPPGCVHGGYVAGAFDEVLGATQSLSGAPGMTGRLTVHYRSPTPLHQELRFVGEIERIDGRKIFTRATLSAGDRLCAEAEGLFISIPVEVFQRLAAEREAAEKARLAG